MVLRQSFVAHRAVEPLHVGVLLRLARLDVFEPDAPFLSPVPNGFADVLRAVVAPDHLGLDSLANDLFQGPDHALRWQSEVHLDAQRLPVEVVDDVEQPKAASIRQLVVHAVHGPD